MTDTDTTPVQHATGSQEMVQSEDTASGKRADRLLRLVEQMTRSGAPLDTGLRDMLAEVTAMEAAYLYADQMSYSQTVLPEYRRDHQPSKGRGNNRTYGPPLGKQAAINGAAAIMYGRALGIGMTQSLQVIHNINGKSGIEARTMQALCEKAGVRFTFDPNNDGDQATVGAERDGHKPVSSCWTMAHAQQRGYTNNPLYNSHPDEMLRAKALAECCRLIAPDVVLGLAFTYEEIQLDQDTTVEVPPKAGHSGKVPGAKGMAALGARVANPTQQWVQPGDHVVAQPMQVQGDGTMLARVQAQADDEAQQYFQVVQDDDLPPDDGVAPEPKEVPANHQPPDEHGLTVLHTALGKAGFEHRSQRLGIAGAMVGRALESTKDLTNDELGRINHQVQAWAREGVVADRCRTLLAGGVPETTLRQDDPAPPQADDDGNAKATTQDLRDLRAAYKNHLMLTGKDMLEHLSQTLGREVTDINSLTRDDAYEATRVAEGKVHRG